MLYNVDLISSIGVYYLFYFAFFTFSVLFCQPDQVSFSLPPPIHLDVLQ